MRSLLGKREPQVQVAPAHRPATPGQKSIGLDELLTATGYTRKDVTRLLAQPMSPPGRIQLPCARRYDAAGREALRIAWMVGNEI